MKRCAAQNGAVGALGIVMQSARQSSAETIQCAKRQQERIDIGVRLKLSGRAIERSGMRDWKSHPAIIDENAPCFVCPNTFGQIVMGKLGWPKVLEAVVPSALPAAHGAKGWNEVAVIDGEVARRQQERFVRSNIAANTKSNLRTR